MSRGLYAIEIQTVNHTIGLHVHVSTGKIGHSDNVNRGAFMEIIHVGLFYHFLFQIKSNVLIEHIYTTVQSIITKAIT